MGLGSKLCKSEKKVQKESKKDKKKNEIDKVNRIRKTILLNFRVKMS